MVETATANASLQDEPEFKPGVLAGVEVSNFPDLELTTEEQNALKALCTKAAKRDTPARLIEVIQAWEAALFYRGFQFLIPLRGGGWKIPGESTGYGPSMQMDLALLPTNIYSSYAQIIISSLTRSVPGVRFQAPDASNDAQITAAEGADKYRSVLKRDNDLIVIQTDAVRYLWTDGRAHYWTRYVRDGQRFGWEENDQPDNIVPETEPSTEQSDQLVKAENEKEVAATVGGEAEDNEAAEEQDTDQEQSEELANVLANRTPRGQEVRTAHGKLEVKMVPMMANSIDECDVLQYEMEVDKSRAKGMFPNKAKDIRAGNLGISEGEIARLARQNVKLGMQSTYVTSDSQADDVTINRTWMRPTYLMGIEKDDVRDSLLRKCPDGVLVCFAGETFVYARNESMDWSWALMHAFSGDGQNRNALGTSIMPIQKRLNNWLDLMNDFFVRAVPKKWMHNKAFNVDALRSQTNVPGDIGAFKPQPGLTAADLIFMEPALQAPAALPEFVKSYSGELAELITGGYPALGGSNTGEGDTATGTVIQRNQALGRLGPTWHSIQTAEARASLQGVKWGAKMRKGTINERIPGGEVVRLEVNDLNANILCFPEADENFPESYPEKQQRLMGIFNDSAKNPALQEVLYSPPNLEFLQNMVALPELYIKQVASYKKQLGEIEVLLAGAPVVNPMVAEGEQKIADLKTKGVDPMLLKQAEDEIESLPPEISTVPIDNAPGMEDHETEALACWIKLTSPEGRKLKKVNRKAYDNIRLHFLEHVAALKQETQNAGAQQQKPPSKSMNLKDMEPGERAQLLLQAGIKADPPPVLPPPGTAVPVGAAA